MAISILCSSSDERVPIAKATLEAVLYSKPEAKELWEDMTIYIHHKGMCHFFNELIPLLEKVLELKSTAYNSSEYYVPIVHATSLGLFEGIDHTVLPKRCRDVLGLLSF
jgi:hypothetical protein